ncbi:uncharacterized protein LOC107611228 [Arachis ipaensis]|uniref:uncharacterized protein LOC107611228 n=1 Tax=Arachis ipaensis TaxID=130454 RepID=UPI0007AF17A4|nr:uncharacterized protein LOC107611228 [Arachis ipaensis]
MGEIQELTRKCPPNMFNERVQLHIFYEGLSYESKKALDHSSGGSLNKKKTIEEAIDVIETMANNDYFYASDRTQKRGVMELNSMDALLAQNKVITAQLAALTKQMEKNQVSSIQAQARPQEEDTPKDECDGSKPTIGECKAITLRSGKVVEETSSSQNKQEEEAASDPETKKEEETPEPPTPKQVLKPYVPKAPYPQRLRKDGKDNQFSRFLEIFKKLQINIPFAEALEKMPLYAKFLKELMTRKRSWGEKETVVLIEECSAIIQKKLPQKLKDPGSFQIPYIIGDISIEKALCDLGASINLMSLAMMKRMRIEEAKPTRMALQLADRTFKFSHGVVEDLLVKVGEFIFPVDFIMLDMEEEANTSIILGRPFLATAGAIINVQKGELVLRLHEEKMVFNIFKAMSYPKESIG